MRWTFVAEPKKTIFKDVDIGECFEENYALYIKVSSESAFDITREELTYFGDSVEVIIRYVEMIIR